MRAYLSGFARAFDLGGKSTRAEFWGFTLIMLALILVAAVADELLALVPADRSAPGPITLAVTLLHLVPAISVQARRLRDIGYAGWWVVISLIPFAGTLALFVVACLPQNWRFRRAG